MELLDLTPLYLWMESIYGQLVPSDLKTHKKPRIKTTN
jgi:hypothetical protein